MTAAEKRRTQARKHVRDGIADTLEGLGLFESVGAHNLGHSFKDLEAAKVEFRRVIRELRASAVKRHPARRDVWRRKQSSGAVQECYGYNKPAGAGWRRVG